MKLNFLLSIVLFCLHGNLLASNPSGKNELSIADISIPADGRSTGSEDSSSSSIATPDILQTAYMALEIMRPKAAAGDEESKAALRALSTCVKDSTYKIKGRRSKEILGDFGLLDHKYRLHPKLREIFRSVFCK